MLRILLLGYLLQAPGHHSLAFFSPICSLVACFILCHLKSLWPLKTKVKASLPNGISGLDVHVHLLSAS